MRGTNEQPIRDCSASKAPCPDCCEGRAKGAWGSVELRPRSRTRRASARLSDGAQSGASRAGDSGVVSNLQPLRATLARPEGRIYWGELEEEIAKLVAELVRSLRG